MAIAENGVSASERAAFEYMLSHDGIRPLLERGGMLRILSERPLCEGCQTAVAEFMSRYPNVHLHIVEGGGSPGS
ncbi:MAG: hypothetical protein JO171_09210 [Paludibacterium sp.]|uniref:hypothetical protein n=1 Tax=Paludibacterium sp. TaxID=1917523 RepID=UPI0025E3B7A3|nr:hypothetical protein [Paludibacterium sp.]MBV8047319.1 hypothetical protein [Paludibacterium sp.]MBV8646187.1 hypothetical protein [Paludibacterium sp.]